MARNIVVPNRLSALKGSINSRKQMINEGLFSLEVDEGYSVVLTSGSTREERESLVEHADKLTEDESRGFFGARIIRQPRIDDIKRVITDPEVTSIAFVGDGNFGTYHLGLPGTADVERVTWYSLARMATHLKKGVVEERTCTRILNPERDVRVALSSFIVSDQTMILGTVEETFAAHHRVRSIYASSP